MMLSLTWRCLQWAHPGQRSKESLLFYIKFVIPLHSLPIGVQVDCQDLNRHLRNIILYTVLMLFTQINSAERKQNIASTVTAPDYLETAPRRAPVLTLTVTLFQILHFYSLSIYMHCFDFSIIFEYVEKNFHYICLLAMCIKTISYCKVFGGN